MGYITDSEGNFIGKSTLKRNIIICYNEGDLARFRDRIRYNSTFTAIAHDDDGNEYRVVNGFNDFDEMMDFIDNAIRFKKDVCKSSFSVARSFKYSKAYICKNIFRSFYKVAENKDTYRGSNYYYQNFPELTDLKFYSMMESYYFASLCINGTNKKEIFNNVYYRDFSQHYASIMFERPLPIAAERISRKSELPEHWFGLWKVDVDMDRFKRLPLKLQQLILLGNCKLAITEMDKPVYEGLGVRFVECVRLYKVTLGMLPTEFRRQIAFCFHQRKHAKERVKEHPGDKYYEFINTMLKLANECCYGNCAKKYFKFKKITKSNKAVDYMVHHKYFKEICSDEYDDWDTRDWLCDDEAGPCSVWQYNEMKHLKYRVVNKLPKLWAVYTVSYSRHDQKEIIDYIADCGGRCLYTDTDSFFYQCDYDCLDGFRGQKVGDCDYLKLEAFFKRAKFPSKKWWCGETENGDFKYAAAGSVGIQEGTNVDNFEVSRGIYLNEKIRDIVKEFVESA